MCISACDVHGGEGKGAGLYETETQSYLEEYLPVSENCLFWIDEITVCCFNFTYL
jgi:hypothetical protein